MHKQAPRLDAHESVESVDISLLEVDYDHFQRYIYVDAHNKHQDWIHIESAYVNFKYIPGIWNLDRRHMKDHIPVLRKPGAVSFARLTIC